MNHESRGEYRTAILYYSARLGQKSDDPDALGGRGDGYNPTGQYDLALADFNQAIALAPNNATHYMRRADCYANKGEYALALQDNDDAVRMSRQDAWSLSSRCQTRAVSGQDLNGALDDCNRALGLLPDLAEGYASRGLLNLRLRQYQQAADDFNVALAKKPTLTIARYGLGVALNHLHPGSGKPDLAKALHTEATIASRFALWGLNR